ncbi:N/A [soil metagenome]
MPPVPETKSMTAAEFLALAAKSRLLSDEQVQKRTANLRRRSTADDVAKQLVADGVLTTFQANKLITGLWQGLVIGRFHILKPVGRGGMGIVYRARDDTAPAGQTDVALKILPPKKAAAEPRTRARFLHEVKIGRDLPKDAHIARVYDTGVTDGIAFIAMEFVVGCTIRSAVGTKGPLSMATAASVFADVALGLEASHKAGVIHRDVKPSNVMITPSGSAKLLDFGFALRPGDPLMTDPSVVGGAGYTLGTFDFIPPEQAVNAAAVTPLADQYSLGCSLYYSLTGQPPFPGGTVKEKLRRHKHEDAVPLSSVRPDLPADFTAIIERLMAKQPSQRYANCRDVANALRPWATVETPKLDFTQSEMEGEEDDLTEIAPHSMARVRTSGYRNQSSSSGAIGIALVVAAIIAILVFVLAR